MRSKSLLVLLLMLTTFSVASADTFNGGGDGTSWEDPLNWDAGVVPANNGGGNTHIHTNFQVDFDADTWAALVAAGNMQNATEHRIARLLLGDATTGAANGVHSITFDHGGTNYVRVTNGTTAVIGARANKDSTLNLLSGILNLEARTVVGSQTDSIGTINVNGGDLIIGRAGLQVGANDAANGGGAGNFNISAGSFTTRSYVTLGSAGVFEVVGSQATQIGIGSEGTLDGEWTQNSGGVLRLGLDSGGITPIFIDDTDDDGLGMQGNVTFDAGSILDPYNAGGAPVNAWQTVMNWEGSLTGTPTLSATSVAAGWESQVAGNELQVRLVSTVMGPPCDLDSDGDCDQADINLLYNFSPNTTDINDWLTQASDSANPYKTSFPGGTVADTYTLGDANLDGDVTSVDLGLLLNNFSSTTALNWQQGNLNGDGVVDSVDLGLLLNNFNFTSASAVNAVPEPNGMALLGLGIAGLLFVRRKK